MLNIDVSGVATPSYICDLGALRGNLEILKSVQERAGCKILLALKGFAMWSVFPIIHEYLPGITASSPHEARLGREEFGGEVHSYAPAYSEADIRDLISLIDHIVFNSVAQWERFGPMVKSSGRRIECAIRVNPEHSEVKTKLYDPCAAGSRLGVKREDLTPEIVAKLDGLHFHTLCELGADSLERTLAAFEAKFGDLLSTLKWVNFGGGHHITRPGYDLDLLVKLITDFKAKYGVEVYLEPGEAIALNTGVLVTSVMDIVHNELPIAILDTSATAHMPDVLEMPYRPQIIGGAAAGEKAHTYRLGGLTCLAGDVVGDWSFDEPLKIGSKLVFLDMAHYTMVKNTTFNGVRLPSIATHDPTSGQITVVRSFGYHDYRDRLS